MIPPSRKRERRLNAKPSLTLPARRASPTKKDRHHGDANAAETTAVGPQARSAPDYPAAAHHREGHAPIDPRAPQRLLVPGEPLGRKASDQGGGAGVVQ